MKKEAYSKLSELWKLWKVSKDLHVIFINHEDHKMGGPRNFMAEIATGDLGDWIDCIRYPGVEYEVSYVDLWDGWTPDRSKTELLRQLATDCKESEIDLLSYLDHLKQLTIKFNTVAIEYLCGEFFGEIASAYSSGEAVGILLDIYESYESLWSQLDWMQIVGRMHKIRERNQKSSEKQERDQSQRFWGSVGNLIGRRCSFSDYKMDFFSDNFQSFTIIGERPIVVISSREPAKSFH